MAEVQTTQVGIGGLSNEQAPATQPGQSQEAAPQSWYPEEHADYAKKFDNLGAALKAGSEAERKITEQGQKLSEHQKFVDEKILPLFGSTENYDNWFSQMQSAAANQPAGQPTGEADQLTPEQQQLRRAEQDFKQTASRQDRAVQETQTQAIEAASQRGADLFFRDHPDAEQYSEAIEKVLASGVIAQPAKPFMDGSHYATVAAAYKIVQAELNAKGQRARAAGEVEGGPGAQDVSEDEMFDGGMDVLRKNLSARQRSAEE